MAKFSTNTVPIYALKHRLAGAAIMILSAVFIIPIFLTESNIQTNIDEGAGLILEEDNTFKSKIEPINLKSLQVSELSSTELDSPAEKPALIKIEETKKTEEQPENENIVEKKVKEKKDKDKEKIVLTSVEDEQPKSVEEEPKKQSDIVKEEVVKDGWTVRVGTFSKNENVKLISDLLNDNGFNTKHTPVTTTLGKATRVWLGPYSTKETAEKISIRLKFLTGEKGYVTKQAS
jgi:cell division septation protein DedD